MSELMNQTPCHVARFVSDECMQICETDKARSPLGTLKGTL
jgi:hypothetical protein